MGRQRQWAAWMMVGLLWAPGAAAQPPQTAPVTLAQATTTTITGQLDENSDTQGSGRRVNWHSIQGNADSTLTIEVSTDGFEVLLLLYNPDNNVVLAQANGTNVRLNVVLPRTGPYIVGVFGTDASTTGSYHLQWQGSTPITGLSSTLQRASVLNQTAIDLYHAGRYQEAENLYQQALVIHREYLGEQHPDVAASLNNLAELYRFQGRYSEAETLFQESLTILRNQLGQNHLNIALNLNNLALLYQDQGRYPEAEFFFRETLAILRDRFGDRNRNVAVNLNNLATLYQAQGRYNEAEALFQESLDLLREQLGEQHPNFALSLNNLAELYRTQGRYGEAEALFQESLDIFREQLGEQHPNFALNLNNLALLYEDLGRFPEAEALFQEALIISREQLGSVHPNVAISLNNLAWLYSTQGSYSEAESRYLEALAILREQLGADHPNVATSLNNLAVMYRVQGRYGEADLFYQEALAISREQLGADHPNVATSLNNLAVSYQAQGRYEEAVASLQAGLDIQELHLELNLAILTDIQRQAYVATISGTTQQATSLHLQSASNSSEAAQLALTTLLRRKGRILDAGTSSRQVLRQNLTPEDQVTLDLLTDTQRQLATLTFNPPSNLPPDQYRARVQELEAEAKQLESTLARRSAAFRAETQPIEIAAVAAQLPTHSVLVEYVRYRPFDAQEPQNRWGPDRYAAYLLFPDGRIEAVDLGPATEIDAAARDFIGLLQDRSTTLRAIARPTPIVEDVQAVTGKMQALILDPIAPYLSDSDHLLISPDSQLNLIPFEALQSEAGGPFLVEQYQISYLNSGRDLLKFNVTEPSRAPAVVLANPDYEQAGFDSAQPATNSAQGATTPDSRALSGVEGLQVGPLPGTAAEAEAIRPLLPNAQILTEEDATENALKQVQAPRILHIATHGFFLANVERPDPNSRGLGVQAFDNPLAPPPGFTIENPLLRSGLALAGFNPRQSGGEDGVLTALEASQLNLFGTQLVVLSACDTGLGQVANGEGVYGLRRAFAIAGAESQLLSLWQVDDFGTQSLMARYYEHLTAGMGRSEALRQVQLEMIRADDTYSHPYYWAAFILAGDWRSLD
jgi:CHAT domain-containing protein